jgi:hypothetical protein
MAELTRQVPISVAWRRRGTRIAIVYAMIAVFVLGVSVSRALAPPKIEHRIVEREIVASAPPPPATPTPPVVVVAPAPLPKLDGFPRGIAPGFPPDLVGDLHAAIEGLDKHHPIQLVMRGDFVALAQIAKSDRDALDRSTDPLSGDFGWTPLMVARATHHFSEDMPGEADIVEVVLENEHALEECHVYGRATEPLTLRDDNHSTSRVEAGARVVIVASKGDHHKPLLRVIARVDGIALADSPRGWTRDAIAPELPRGSSSTRVQFPLYGDESDRPVQSPLRVRGCSAYAAYIVDGNGDGGWIAAMRGPGWGG